MSRQGKLSVLLVVVGLVMTPWEALGQANPEVKLASRLGKKKVTGGLAKPFRDLQDKESLPERMWVHTGEDSGAHLAILNNAGTVRMGPESEIELRKPIVDFATGAVSRLDFWVNLGRLRFVFFRASEETRKRARLGPLGVPPREILIITPNNTETTLVGTDVQVEVTPDGSSSIFVIEGTASVKSKDGTTVRVRAGQWTSVGVDGPPEPPRPFGDGTHTPGPDSFPADFDIIPDPPSLIPPDLDLPKADWP